MLRSYAPQPIIRFPSAAPFEFCLSGSRSPMYLCRSTRHLPPEAATRHPKCRLVLINQASGPLMLSRLRRFASLAHMSTCQLAS
jgi:hypothetical protein